MKLAGRVPVEQLDDERLTNIERRIVSGAADAAAQARPARPARFGAALAVAALAVVVAGAGVAGWQLRGGGGSLAAREPVAGAAGAVKVRTDARRATLELGDATIESDPDTAFEVTRPDGGVLVTLARGKVELEVAKRAGRAPLVVRAGDTDVIVVGTRFTVDFGDGRGDVAVRVSEGVVRVVRHQHDVKVAANEEWTTARGVQVASAGGPGERGRRGDGEPGGEPGDGGDRDEPGAGHIEIELGDGPEVLRDRTARVPDVRGARPGAAGAGSAATRTITPREPRVRTLDPGDPQGDLKALIRSQPVVAPLDVGATEPQAAMSKYRTIMATATGAEAAHAFYSMAVLQHLKLGRNGDADAQLDSYFRRFQRSDFHAPALWLRVRIRCLRDIDDRCRQAAEAYLRGGADGPAARVAERIALSH